MSTWAVEQGWKCPFCNKPIRMENGRFIGNPKLRYRLYHRCENLELVTGWKESKALALLANIPLKGYII